MRKEIFVVLAIALFVAMPLVMAVDLNQQPSDADKATFDQILEPVMKIYNLIKYIASAIAGIALLGAGLIYMTSGADPKKRDNAKSTAMYVIIGLVVIWAAPFMISLIVG